MTPEKIHELPCDATQMASALRAMQSFGRHENADGATLVAKALRVTGRLLQQHRWHLAALGTALRSQRELLEDDILSITGLARPARSLVEMSAPIPPGNQKSRGVGGKPGATAGARDAPGSAEEKAAALART